MSRRMVSWLTFWQPWATDGRLPTLFVSPASARCYRPRRGWCWCRCCWCRCCCRNAAPNTRRGSACRTDYVRNLKTCTRQRGQPCWGVCLPRAALAPCCRRNGERADEKRTEKPPPLHADAAGMSSRALPGSNTIINRSPDRSWTLICRSQRVQPATTASDCQTSVQSGSEPTF